MQPTRRSDGAEAGSSDYFKLFDSNASWPTVADRISIFKIYPELLRDAPDEQIRLLVRNLASRHVALGLEAPVLATRSNCSQPAVANAWVVALTARLKRLGGDLKVFAMVGPLIDGRGGHTPGQCRRPLGELAAEAALTTNEIKKLYPSLEIGEIEPLGVGPRYPDWRDLDHWFSAWRHASGAPLAFMHMDMVWGTAWQSDLRRVADATKRAGIRFGVIYDGNSSDLSDSSYSLDVLHHVTEVETTLRAVPDDVLFQSWDDFPRHALPETDTTSAAGTLRAYLRHKTHLELDFTNRLRLLREDRTGVGDAEVLIERQVGVRESTQSMNRLEGIVPHSAAYALFALRIHTECACAEKTAALSLGGYSFTQIGLNDIIRNDLRGWLLLGFPEIHPSPKSPQPMIEISAGPHTPLVLNGPRFQVRPDNAFSLDYQALVGPDSENTGFAALIFFGTDGNEVRRTFQIFRSTWAKIGGSITTSDGYVAIPQQTRLRDRRRLRFAGTQSDGPTTLLLPIVSNGRAP